MEDIKSKSRIAQDSQNEYRGIDKVKLEKQKKLQKQKKKQAIKNDKDRYFSYYDDIKVGSHKIVDW